VFTPKSSDLYGPASPFLVRSETRIQSLQRPSYILKQRLAGRPPPVRTRPSVLHPSQGDSANVAKAGASVFVASGAWR
jgi:hypothetical protein